MKKIQNQRVGRCFPVRLKNCAFLALLSGFLFSGFDVNSAFGTSTITTPSTLTFSGGTKTGVDKNGNKIDIDNNNWAPKPANIKKITVNGTVVSGTSCLNTKQVNGVTYCCAAPDGNGNIPNVVIHYECQTEVIKVD